MTKSLGRHLTSVFAMICEAFLSCERPGVCLPREVRLLADGTGKSRHGAEVELLLLRSREVQLEGMGGGEGVARGGRRRRGRRWSRAGRPHVTEGSEGLLVPTWCVHVLKFTISCFLCVVRITVICPVQIKSKHYSLLYEHWKLYQWLWLSS